MLGSERATSTLPSNAPTPRRYTPPSRSSPPNERREFERERAKLFFFELDRCHGTCPLAQHHGLVADALEHFHKKRLWLGDYVVMPNHVHAIVQPFPGVSPEDWLYSVKRFSANQINQTLGGEGKVWQAETFDRVIRDREELARTRCYIQNNPTKLKPNTFALHQAPWLDEFATL